MGLERDAFSSSQPDSWVGLAHVAVPLFPTCHSFCHGIQPASFSTALIQTASTEVRGDLLIAKASRTGFELFKFKFFSNFSFFMELLTTSIEMTGLSSQNMFSPVPSWYQALACYVLGFLRVLVLVTDGPFSHLALLVVSSVGRSWTPLKTW